MIENFLPPITEDQVSRWDKEWMLYFATEPAGAHVLPYEHYRLNTNAAELVQLSSEAVFNLTLATNDTNQQWNVPLHVWAPGQDLVNRSILEIGCGCGFLGKQIGLVAKSYLGFDYSRIAVAIARGVSPTNCLFFHLSDRKAIEERAGSMDSMVSREFFIHQNYDNAKWLLKLGCFLLKPSALIRADFYWPDQSVRQGIVHPAKHPLDPKYASCAFAYTDEDLTEIAKETEVEILEIEIYKPYQRKFVTFRV
jgi:SAM-dependent methyltransferase